MPPAVEMTSGDDTNTKIHEDRFRHSSSIKLIISMVLHAEMLVVLIVMRVVNEVCL